VPAPRSLALISYLSQFFNRQARKRCRPLMRDGARAALYRVGFFCLLIELSEGRDTGPLKSRRRSASRLFPALLLLLCAAACAPAHAASPGSHRTHPRTASPSSLAEEGRWTLAFELAFGDSSPYSSKFPSLYDERLPYGVRRAITKYVLDRIILIALREAGARQIELAYRPGGYNDFPVVPSAQLTVRASDKSVRRALNIIGYLAQQTAVIGSKKSGAGKRFALEIVEGGSRKLSERTLLERFWRRLAALSPKLGPGFSSIERGGRPGIYIIDSEGDWKPEELEGFARTARTISAEFGIQTVARSFTVEYLELGNDWKRQADGAAYLDRLGQEGVGGLRRRLVRLYRPQVELLILRAFKKYAPGILKEKRAAVASVLVPLRSPTVEPLLTSP
jgi:hypothetical protein